MEGNYESEPIFIGELKTYISEALEYARDAHVVVRPASVRGSIDADSDLKIQYFDHDQQMHKDGDRRTKWPIIAKTCTRATLTFPANF